MLKKILILAISTPLVLVGCSSNIGSTQYNVSEVGEAVQTYQGTIIDKRVVEVKGNTAAQLGGAAAGAVGGGALGSLAGSGGGKTAMTVGGAALGALAGHQVAKELTAQQAFEYTVKLTNGNIRTVVQGADVDMAVGQKVFLQVSKDGRSRIMPDNSGT